jgi:hypothetical protein
MANKVTGWQDTVLTDEQARDLPCPNTYCNTYKTNYTCKACIQAKATWEVAYKAGQKSGRQEVVDWVKFRCADAHATCEKTCQRDCAYMVHEIITTGGIV